MSHHNRRGHRDFGGDPRGGGRARYGSRGGYSGGGGRGPSPPVIRPTEAEVAVNYYKLNIDDPSKIVDMDFFKVDIKSAAFKVKMDEDGNKILDDSGRVVREFTTRYLDDKFKKRFFSSMKPWRIYKQLNLDQQTINPSFDLFYDGVDMALSFSRNGPSDDSTTYRVCIKRDCESDHPDADKVRNEWFEVLLTKTHTISSLDLVTCINGGGSRDVTSEVATAINVILKSAGIKAGMISLGTESSSLYFPLHDQQVMFNKGMIQSDDNKKILLSGVKQTAIFSQSGCHIQTDPIVTWFNKDKLDMILNARNDKLPIVDFRSQMIAGVRVDFGRLPNDPDAQGKIEEVLSKLLLNFEYVSKSPNAEKEEGMRARGKSQSEIEESRRKVFLNQSLKRDKDTNNSKIKWSPDHHSFQKGDVEVTVTKHYLESYGIQLDRNLPIVFVGKMGWLPLEFAYQSFEKTKDSNEVDMVRKVLKYYDGIAGTNLQNEMREKRRLMTSKTETAFAEYGLRIDTEPSKLKAKILREPTIKFDDRFARVTNGSFDLRGVKFASPANLDSFAVVKYTNKGAPERDFIPLQLDVSCRHGINISKQTFDVGGRYIHSVTEQVPDQGRGARMEDFAPEAIRRAIQKARNVFLEDSEKIYQGQNALWHKTTCCVDGRVIECLVLPPNSLMNESDEIGLVLKSSGESLDDEYALKLYSTHDIEFRNNPNKACDRARLKVKCNKDLFDPFDVEVSNGGKLYVKGQEVEFGGYVFECHLKRGKPVKVDANPNVLKIKPLHKERNYPVHCPSVIFQIFPDNGKALYDSVKNITNNMSGIQTQCIDVSKFNSQKNKDQYASNIAAKLNTKLSDSFSRSAAWNSATSTEGIQWISECPTLVIGIGLVHGMGYGADTVVSAYSCLDLQCMRLASAAYLQKKSDVVNKSTIIDIVAEFYDKYCAANPRPLRILVFRDGVSDGSFHKIDDEIAAVREAVKAKSNASCTCNCGCIMCCPPITFIICQSQHSVRIVPSTEENGYSARSGGVNVHSGTVVDDRAILQSGALLGISDEDVTSIRASNQRDKQILGVLEDSYDFLLTAQGGLKGTSKPVYYRVRLNENAVWGPAGTTPLTRENLMNATYQMSYKFGSATKATREIPVLKYAKKLGNQVLSGLKYLRAGMYWDGKECRLEYPLENMEDEHDNRPYVHETFKVHGKDEEVKMHNLLKCSFHTHLAA